METKKFLSYLLALSLVGCVPVLSLHPLFTEKDVVFEQKVVGVWVDESEGTWQFKGIDDPAKAYEMSLTDKEGKKGLFVAHLVKLKDRLFLDIRPKQFPAGGEDVEKMELLYNAFFFVPAHTFLAVDSLEPEFRMRWANRDEIKELLEKDPNAVKHEIVEDTIVLTAPTKKLQQFVLKYADDREVFGNEIILRRKKAVKPSEPEATDPS
jgi:hypothetical protein